MRTIIALMLIALVPGALALTVESPAGEVESPVDITISSNESTDLSFSVEEFNGSCTNCTLLEDSIELEPGNYTLTASDVNDSVEVDFTVIEVDMNETDTNETEETLELTIDSPSGEQENPVLLEFMTNMPADLTYDLNGTPVEACLDCSDFSDSVELALGEHTLTVWALTSNETANETVVFSVINVSINDTDMNDTDMNDTDTNETDTNETDDEGNETGEPRYTLGLNKLPQSVEAGELTDAELAAIIRENSLNPGVINRLVKTGLLGDESIDAIIETQRTPPGIFRKVLSFFGITVKTPKEKLLDHYNLTDEQQVELLTSDDVQEDTAEEIREDLQSRGKPIVPPGQAKKTSDQESDNLPPGQAKKAAASEESGALPSGLDNGSGKVPPGQVKKALKAGGQNGKVPPGQAKKS